MLCGYCEATGLHCLGCPGSRIISEREKIKRRTDYFDGRDAYAPGKSIPKGTSKAFRLGWKAGQKNVPVLTRRMMR